MSSSEAGLIEGKDLAISRAEQRLHEAFITLGALGARAAAASALEWESFIDSRDRKVKAQSAQNGRRSF